MPYITLRQMLSADTVVDHNWRAQGYSSCFAFLLRQWLSVCGCVFIWLEILWQHHILYLQAWQSLPWYLLLVSNIELVIFSLTED